MKKLDRYIIATVLVGALAGLLVVVCLSFVLDFVNEANDIGKGRYTLASAMLVVALFMVQRAYEVFPMATLIGALVSLGTLAARGELVAMRAAGVSIAQIARSVVIAGVGLALLAAAIGEWAAPQAIRMAQSIQANAQGGQVGLTAGGLWARDGHWVIRADQVAEPTLLTGVRAYAIKNTKLTQVITAPQARYDGSAWVFSPAEITQISTAGVEVSQRELVRLGGELSPATLEVVSVDVQTLAGSELTRYIRYLENNNLNSARYQLALWVKIAMPLATMVMLLLSVPLVFASVRSKGVGQQIFIGVMIGLAFFLLNRFLGNVGLVYGLPPALSALAPTMLFLGLALIALRRVR
jgi:lipopolysaccharide export system permease protein